MTIRDIARLAHEVNRAYCIAIDDDSQSKWEDAPEWQKASAIDGVRFHIDEDHEPEESHDRWMQMRLDNGWVYGDEKNESNKTHPCLVPFNELPKEQQVKDHLFRAVVHACRDLWV